jgi:competence transcription factor ComK
VTESLCNGHSRQIPYTSTSNLGLEWDSLEMKIYRTISIYTRVKNNRKHASKNRTYSQGSSPMSRTSFS